MNTDATICKVCGGPFATKRIIIEGEAYHQRCAVMSYPPHTPQDMNRMGEEIQRLRDALQKIANLPLEKTDTFKRKPDPIVRARQIAVAALSAVTLQEGGKQ